MMEWWSQYNNYTNVVQSLTVISTVEPLNKRHFGANSFVPCREVPISEVNTIKYKCPL